MSSEAPAGAACLTHRETPARWACRRCGAFFCVACERRTRPDALPMCPACWELRSRNVVDQTSKPSTAIFTASLVLGIISLLPLPVVMFVSLVVGLMALVRAKNQFEAQRWKPIVGLVLTVLSLLGWFLLLVLAA
ncbi:MAG: hypothetical protein MUC96_19895 [Myxococcaceae bacterium]|nr:hypothetical protein [Myxococcaceae bacterium]